MRIIGDRMINCVVTDPTDIELNNVNHVLILNAGLLIKAGYSSITLYNIIFKILGNNSFVIIHASQRRWSVLKNYIDNKTGYMHYLKLTPQDRTYLQHLWSRSDIKDKQNRKWAIRFETAEQLTLVKTLML